jgi:VWFA-related protein
MHRKLRLFICEAFALVSLCSRAAGQTGATVELVAYSKDNQTVKDLAPTDIELRLDGRPVSVEALKLESKQPPRMILLVDTGYSALNDRTLLKDMVAAFIDIKPSALEMALATINETQQFLSSYQRSSDELVSTLEKMRFGGSSFLSQSILEALNRFEPDLSSPARSARRVVVTFSDGSDASSSGRWNQVTKMMRDNNFVYYEINHIQAMKAMFDYKFNDKELIRLAEESGGHAFRMSELGDIARVAREIYDRETNTYRAAIGVDSKLTQADRNRFKVKSRRKDIRVEVVAVY